MKNLFKIPIFRRSTKLGAGNSQNKVTCMELDGVGFYIRHREPNELNPENIRLLIMGREETSAIVEAETPELAVAFFFDTYEGAMTGGKDKESKALWINESKPILALPPCEYLQLSSRGEFICGDEEGENGMGEFGMSSLEGYDDEWCPITKFLEQEWRKDAPQRSITVREVVYALVTHEDMPLLTPA